MVNSCVEADTAALISGVNGVDAVGGIPPSRFPNFGTINGVSGYGVRAARRQGGRQRRGLSQSAVIEGYTGIEAMASATVVLSGTVIATAASAYGVNLTAGSQLHQWLGDECLGPHRELCNPPGGRRDGGELRHRQGAGDVGGARTGPARGPAASPTVRRSIKGRSSPATPAPAPARTPPPGQLRRDHRPEQGRP